MQFEHIRLNKFLATHAGLSRREADELIEQGRVTVNGQPAALGGRVVPSDTIAIDGKPVTPHTELTYLALHKPPGYVCSRKKQGSADTIYSLLPEQYHALKPVGRLDKDSSGLILLTNDGDFAHRMTHPSFHKTKIYEVSLDHPLQPLHQQMISDFGVMLEDGKSQFLIEKAAQHEAKAELQGEGQDDEFTSASQRRGKPLLITMREGRNRQIRRTFAALDYTVTRLHRTHFGPYSLGSLQPGAHAIIAKP